MIISLSTYPTNPTPFVHPEVSGIRFDMPSMSGTSDLILDRKDAVKLAEAIHGLINMIDEAEAKKNKTRTRTEAVACSKIGCGWEGEVELTVHDEGCGEFECPKCRGVYSRMIPL